MRTIEIKRDALIAMNADSTQDGKVAVDRAGTVLDAIRLEIFNTMASECLQMSH